MKSGQYRLSVGAYTILFKFKGVSEFSSQLNLVSPKKAPVQMFCSNMVQQHRCRTEPHGDPTEHIAVFRGRNIIIVDFC